MRSGHPSFGVPVCLGFPLSSASGLSSRASEYPPWHVSDAFNSAGLFFYFFKIFFFFLMWTTFKVFIEFVAAWLLLFYVLAFWPRGMWDLSSPTKDQKHIRCVGSKVPTSGPAGKSPLDSSTSSPPSRQPLPVPPLSEPSLFPLSSALGKGASKPRTSISSSLFLTSSVGHRLSDPTALSVAASSLSEFL